MSAPTAPAVGTSPHMHEAAPRVPQGLGRRLTIAAAFTALLIGGALLAVQNYTLDWLQAETIAADQRTLGVYTAGIVATLDRYPRSIVLLSQDPRLERAFGGEPGASDLAAQILSEYTALSGAESAFLLDPSGGLVAASNGTATSGGPADWFASLDAFDATLTGRLGRAFGSTRAGGGRRYYFGRRIRSPDETLGILVVVVAIDELELLWRLAQREVLIVDKGGVVVLSSDPAWLLHRAQAGGSEPQSLHGGSDLVALPFTLPAVDGCSGVFDVGGEGRLCQATRIHHLEWDAYLLSPSAPLVRQARIITFEAALGLLSAALIAGFAWQRLTLKERTNRALQGRVEARTAQLQTANSHLRQEIQSRIAKEDELHQAQDDLVQAGKMAALGQMAAGLVHELNQPLAAMRTYNDNTAKFLALQQPEAAGKNIGLMQELIERMASISAQLKNFVQRTPLRLEPVELGPAIESAIRLIEDTSPAAKTRIVAPALPADASVKAEPVRLQQVLVNLIRNGVEAIGEGQGQVRVAVSADQRALSVRVSDDGPGIARQDLGRVFDPFFTTKPGGQGMGLGLSVSQRITKDFGGSLRVENQAGGGSCFILTLRRWNGDQT